MTHPNDDENLDSSIEGAQGNDESDQVSIPGEADRRPNRILNGITSSLESRRSSWAVDVALFAFERNRRIPSSLFAGALASRILIFAIPFILVTAVTTGLYADVSDGDVAEIAQDAGMPGLVAEVAGESAEATDGVRLITILAMSFAALWAADRLGKLVRRTYALMWAVPVTPLRWRWLLPVWVVLVAMVGLAVSRIGLTLDQWPWEWVMVATLAEAAALTMVWILVTLRLPRDPEAYRWIHSLPGAIVVGIGVVGMKTAVVLYFAPHAESLSDRYGDIAAALLLLTWSYWLAFIVVYSAELNAAMFRSRMRRAEGAS